MSIPKSIKQVTEDHISGSVTLLNRLIVVLENELMNPELDAATFISWVEYVRKKVDVFAVIRHFCNELIQRHQLSVRTDPANYLNHIREYREFWKTAPKHIAANLEREINLENKTIMVHSNSGTLKEAFQVIKTARQGIHFYQTLSAPVHEGKIQAHALAEMGYKVTVITDALAAEMMKDTDYLILGADQVTKKSIINKTGSLQMVLAAKKFGVPVIILTESRKMSLDEEKPFRDSVRDTNEVLNELRHVNISAVNLYFEEFPKKLVDHFITEKQE